MKRHVVIVLVAGLNACSPAASPTGSPPPEDADTGTPATSLPTGGTPPQPTDNDRDGDGYAVPDDCDDSDPSTYPGAEEGCDDAKDRNCDGIPGTENDSDLCVYNGSYAGTFEVLIETGAYDGGAPNLIDPDTLESTTCSGSASLEVDVTAGALEQITGTLSCGPFQNAAIWQDWLDAAGLGLAGCELLDFDVNGSRSRELDPDEPYFNYYGGVVDVSCQYGFGVLGPVLSADPDPAASFGFGVGFVASDTAWHITGTIDTSRAGP